VRKKTSRRKYRQLAENLGFNDVKQMTGISIREDNTDALMGLAQSNIYAVSAELQKQEYTHFFAEKHRNRQDSFIPPLYFMIRSHAPPSFKIMLQQLTRSIILRTSLNISGRGYKGKTRHRTRYYPGMPEFDLNLTLFNYFQNGAHFLQQGDIVGIERRQRKRNVVLMLDTSGSMFGDLLLNAALTTSVLSYAMEKDFTSVILFNSEAYVLKKIKEKRVTTVLIDQILESEAVGFTNIAKGLHYGLKELHKIRGNRRKVGIVITDGDFNRGMNPAIIARKFPKLHVINMPPAKHKENQSRGRRVCQTMALAGRGKFVPVKNMAEIPRALMGLLAKF